MKKYLSYGMAGGSLHAFIGAVHRIGAGFDGIAARKAGCFSRNPEKNQECGDFYQLDKERIYSSFEEMAQKEGAREDGIDYVVFLLQIMSIMKLQKCSCRTEFTYYVKNHCASR